MLTAKRISILFAVGFIGCLIAYAYVSCSPSAKPGGFDPKLHLQWPGTPDESQQIVGNSKHYTARLTRKGASGTLYLSLNVDEDPGFAKLAPKDALDSFTFAFRKNETSRKEIEVGPKKYPGL
jgi:hypothetical protein